MPSIHHATVSSKSSCFHESLVLFQLRSPLTPTSYEVFLANQSRGTLLIEIFQQTKLLICECNTTVVYSILSVVTAPFSVSSQMSNHSQQQNTTLSLALLSPSECIAWLTVFGIEVVAMVMLNALVIIIYMRERSLCKRSMYLVTNQAVADMFVGGSVIIECWVLGNRCEFWAINNFSTAPSVFLLAFSSLFSLASLLNLTAISLDRAHATFRPFKHRLVKKKIFGLVIVAVWFTAGLFTTCTVLTFFNQLSTFKFKATFLSYLSFLLLCLLIILVSYSSIAIKIVCGNQPHHHGATNRERKLTKTLFIVTVVSLLLTLPCVILWILNLVSFHTGVTLSFQARFRLNSSVVFLVFENSFVNPVLYTFRMPEFKRALFAFLSCRSQPQPIQVFPLNEM